MRGVAVVSLVDGFAFRSFCGHSGTAEHYITVEAPGDLSLLRQLDIITQRYAEAMQTLRLRPDSAVFRRFYLSDAANQDAVVRRSSLFGEPQDSPVAVSIVEQPPLSGGKVAMLAYHLESPAELAKSHVPPQHVLVERGRLGHLWSTQLSGSNSQRPRPAGDQTEYVFDSLVDALSARGATLAANCVRTWIYIKDIDMFYQDVVAARTGLFNQHGLTLDTHYIASTAIGGACAGRFNIVMMDAYSILGLESGQVSYLSAYDRICATKDYNVTFERGTRVAYSDRAHHFISGTASIDAAGDVVHVGNVERQAGQALDNVDALLRSGGASLADMTHFIVYLRDSSDYPALQGYFAERFPQVPRLIVRGAVCRPEWLVEVEGVAIVPHDGPALPPF
jgi:enamine deaminase RidA (YjgF/YER057c/UK114 family)